jgi:uncharacterized lipoprotein YddW (UPF0748 family)
VKHWTRLAAACVISGLLGASTFAASEPPPAPREFRAAWVATVQNIDWPSKRGLSTADQKKEIDAILDRARELRLNCLVVQIRTTADALYDSKLEPWSIYITGEQGKAPDPYYDPLTYWIEGGRARGIEIHAWFNPYRAKHVQAKDTKLDPSHVAVAMPALVKEYGGFLWLDPGHPAAAKGTLDVFMDVVDRYDIDGIHIDDYFYPYPVRAKPDDPKDTSEIPFPDDDTYKTYTDAGGTLSRDDWRRQNVNKLVENIHIGIQSRKKWVKFGISPFGIPRAGLADGIKGFDQYEKLYADAELWLREGWCDYWTPQLYWPIAQRPQSYPVLLDYWIGANPKGRHIWPGLYTGKVTEDSPRKFPVTEPVNQILLTRSRAGSTGHVHFSFKVFQESEKNAAVTKELNTLLLDKVYTTDALVPATPWLDDVAPPAPKLAFDASTRKLSVDIPKDEPVNVLGVWTRAGESWSFHTISARALPLELKPDVEEAVVTTVDRSGNESPRVRVTTK